MIFLVSRCVCYRYLAIQMSDISNIIWGSNSRTKRKLSVICDENADCLKTSKKEKCDTITNELADTKNGTNTTGLIYSRNNHVYFYTDTSLINITTLQKEIDTIIESFSSKLVPVKIFNFNVKYPPIILHINSPGGSVFAAFMFIDYMNNIRKRYPYIKFHSLVEGRAASAATLISVTADKRFISEYGYMLIHQLSSMSYGKYNELKDDMTNSDKLMERIREIYKKYTKVPHSELNEILGHDLYWDAETCKKYKLVDVINK